MKRYTFLILILFCLWSCATKQKVSTTSQWAHLFNGNDLSGWHIKGGNATYLIEGNNIVGTSAMNTPNTFLCTNKLYADFILELEFKVDSRLNSGIQIRSLSDPNYYEGAVHGYQVEIDPSDRSWSAGIYDESRRGWLYNLENNPPARAAFKNDQWNHYRIEAIGDTIKTWVNNIAAAHLIDDMTGEGFIGLQVHSIGDDQTKDGSQVRWRNIRIITNNVNQHSKETSLTGLEVKK